MWAFYQKIGFPSQLWLAIQEAAAQEGVHPAKWIRDTLSRLLGVS